MPDLKDSFDLFRGDLLYGQSRDRGAALIYLPREMGVNGPVMQAAIDAGAWITVDNLNVPTSPDDEHKVYRKVAKDDYWEDVVKAQKGQFATHVADTESSGTQKFRSGEYAVALDKYYKDIKRHKFSPLSSFDAPRDKLEAEGWKNAGESLRKDRYYLAIRRACKFGIEHVASQSSGALIHFILNRFDQGDGWSDVLNKKPINVRGREAVLITYSELRFVYKNWGRFKSKVIFYRFVGTYDNPTSFPSCDAPWEDTSRTVTGTVYDWDGAPKTQTLTLAEFWKENYSPYNARRYKTLVGKLKARYATSYTMYRRDIDNWEDLGNICLEGCNPEMAINYYKQCIAKLRS